MAEVTLGLSRLSIKASCGVTKSPHFCRGKAEGTPDNCVLPLTAIKGIITHRVNRLNKAGRCNSGTARGEN